MPTYFYIAKSFKGEVKSGSLEVKDKHELARILRGQGYLLISAESKVSKKKFRIILAGKVKLSEKIFFTRNLQAMISAGVSLPRALMILSEQTKNRRFKIALEKISDNILKGKNFSNSLALYPDIFSEVFINMVKVGEEAGTLERVLNDLVYQMERENSLKSRVKGAMMYPAVVIVVMIGIGILMMIMVVPRLSATFEELGVELPFTTQLIISFGNFLTKNIILILISLFIFILVMRLILKTKAGKKTIDAISLRFPVISDLIKKSNSASMLRTLSALITSGVPIVRALEISAGASGNFYYRESLNLAAEKVQKGLKMSEVLKRYKNIYPDLVVQMTKIGEETGQTADMFSKLADFFESEVEIITKNIASIIEPVITVILGIAVGFFAISMIQPMYSMLKAF